MKKTLGATTSTKSKEHHGHLLFIQLENFFRSKGHSATQATELAHEAMDELESWYEEKLEELDDE